jgi:hypothetical protein
MDRISFSFFVFNDTAKRLTFFTIIDFAILFIWLILILGFALYKVSKNNGKEYYKDYLKHLFYKIGFALVFSLYYIFYVKGGDSIAFYDMAGCMNKLFLKSPDLYLNNLLNDFNSPDFMNAYDLNTGLPPRWIMTEKESFFVGKVVSLFSFIAGNSFLTISVLFATITANVTWRFYELILKIFPDSNRWVTYSILFIPSLSFWCTGISKDTLVVISIFSIVTHVFSLLLGFQKSKLISYFLIIFHVWMMYHLRSVVLISLMLPIFIALSSRISNRFREFAFFRRFVQLLIGLVSIGGFFIGIQSYGDEVSVEKYIKEAEVQTKDFNENKLYTGKKYSIEVTDYSPIGLIKVFPQAILAGLFRPYIWEALSVSLFLNGIESSILIYFVYKFFTNNRRRRIKMIRENEFLLFSFFFILIFGFITGFSSIIFGVLVRLRAPLLPFLALLLVAEPKDAVEPTEIIDDQSENELIKTTEFNLLTGK